MKKIKNLLLLAMAFGAITFTSCSKTASSDHDTDAEEAVDEAATEVAAEATDMAEETGEASSDAPSFAWSSDLDEWVTSGTGSKTIVLSGLGDEETGLSESGQAQLNLIANILESNEGVKANIKGHTDSDQKIGNGKGRAMWAKAKLIVGHDAVGSRISTEGVGTNEPLEGVDLADDSQKRVSVTFSK